MVLQHDDTALVAKRLDDALALLLAEHDAAKGLVHGLGSPEVARVLADDVERPAKGRPGLAVLGVGVAGGVDVGASAVDGAVDHEAGGVDGRLVAADDLAVLVDLDHVAGLEHAKVDSEAIWRVSNNTQSQEGSSIRQGNPRVDPKGVGVDGIAHANVAAGALGVSLSGEDPEGARHVLELPLALLVGVGDVGDAGEGIAARGQRGQVGGRGDFFGRLVGVLDGFLRLFDSGGRGDDGFDFELGGLGEGWGGSGGHVARRVGGLSVCVCDGVCGSAAGGWYRSLLSAVGRRLDELRM